MADDVRETPQARSARICREAAKACEEGRLDDARRILDSERPRLPVTPGTARHPGPEARGQRGSEAGCYG